MCCALNTLLFEIEINKEQKKEEVHFLAGKLQVASFADALRPLVRGDDGRVIGALVAEHLATVATVVLADGNRELGLAVRALAHRAVVHPLVAALLVDLHLFVCLMNRKQ